MVPILLGSVAALALVIERLWYFWRTRADVDAVAGEVIGRAKAGDLRGAVEAAEGTRHPVGAVLRAGLEHPESDERDIERAMEREGRRQIGFLERNLNLLLVVVGVEPLLGFLGTILGLIEAFMAWEKHSNSVTVANLAGGIYTAMITTAAGLIVAIPYFVAYHLLLGKVSRAISDLNHYGDELAGVLARRSKGKTA